MNKKIKSSLLLTACLMSISFLGGCKNKNNPVNHTHEFTNYISDNNATCTQDGTKTAKCNGCDVTDTKVDSGSALGHSFTNYIVKNNATCTEDGTKIAKCERCDATDTKQDTGSSLGHSFTNYVSDKNATCTEDGTKTAKCDRCDATDTKNDPNTKGHTFASTYSYDENTHWYAATCGHNLKSGEEAHTFASPIVVQPTVAVNGSKTYKCKCGYSYTEVISNENLVYTVKNPSEETLRTPATCDKKATYFYTDVNGNKGSIYYEYGELLPHSYSYNIINNNVVITCDNCGFNTAKDYSDKKDNELTNENIFDILLNSNIALCRDSAYEREVIYLAKDIQISKYYGKEGNELSLYNEAFYKVSKLDGSMFESRFGFFDEDCELFLEGCDFYNNKEILERLPYIRMFISFDFKYDANKRTYVTTHKYDEDVFSISIKNKKITSFSGNGFSLYDSELPEEHIAAINDMTYNFRIDDGIYKSYENESCEHSFKYVFGDENNPRTYIECELCGYSSLDCGDYSNVDDDKLTDAQLSDLILNSKIVLVAYDDEGEIIEYDYYDGGFLLYKTSYGENGWVKYKNINKDVMYGENGNCTDFENLNKSNCTIYKNIQRSSTLLGFYSCQFDIPSIGSLNYVYDSESSSYVYDNGEEHVSIKVTDGKISDIFISCDSFIDHYLLDEIPDFISENVIEKFNNTYYTVIDSVEENKFFLCDGDSIIGEVSKENVYSNADLMNNFFYEKYGFAFNYNSYYFYDSNTGYQGRVINDYYGLDLYFYDSKTEYSVYIGDSYIREYSSSYIDKNTKQEISTEYEIVSGELIATEKTVCEADLNGLWDYTAEYQYNPETETFVLYTLEENTFYENGYEKTTHKIEYCLDDLNNPYILLELTSRNDENNHEIYYEVMAYDNSLGKLIGDIKNEYAYSGNTLVVEKSYSWNFEENNWVLTHEYKADFFADGKGKTIYQISYNIDGDIIDFSRNDSLYDDNNREIEHVYYNYNYESETLTISSKSEYTYDERGNKIMSIRYEYDTEKNEFIPLRKDVYEYNESNQKIATYTYNYDKTTQDWVLFSNY